MTNMQDNNSQKEAIEYSDWNPFIPTRKDIQRTEELAKKSPGLAGFLCFLMPLLSMIYLNRGVNNLKILGYVFIASVIIGATSSNIEKYESRSEYVNEMSGVVQISGLISLIIENSRSVTLARKRLAAQEQTLILKPKN